MSVVSPNCIPSNNLVNLKIVERLTNVERRTFSTILYGRSQRKLRNINKMINIAAAKNVDFIALPETANCISNSKTHQDKVLQVEEEDITLASLIKAAKNKSLNILVGSLALKHNKSGHKLINRSFFIDTSGKF